MELKSCGTAHFIQTIRGGLVIKVCNIISHKRPVIRYKILKDVYESEDAKRLQKRLSSLVFDHRRVKREGPCFLLADRTLQEIKSETDEFASHADDDLGGGLDDGTTLKQLKKRLSKKKRKHIHLDENLQSDNTNEKTVQDESDLNEPIITWKAKHSKTSKAKRKRLEACVISSSTIDIAIKSEENLVSECSPQVGCGPASDGVKVEVPDAEQLECQYEISSSDATSIGHNEVPNPAEKMVLIEYSREPELPCVNTYGNCVNNEISYDYVEDAQPISVIFLRDAESTEFETLETASTDSPDNPSMEIEKQTEVQDSHPCGELLLEDPNPDLSSHSSSSSVENMPEESSSGTQVPGMAMVGCMGLHQECNPVVSEGRTEADLLYEPNDSLTSLDKNCGSNLDSVAPSETEKNQTSMDVISDKKQSSACSLISNELNCEGHVEDESLEAADRQNSAFTVTGAGNEASLEHMSCDSADRTLIPEPHQPPERLLSTRKAFSPSSQEQLRMAMNSDDICNDSNQNIVLECKEKLFENQTEKKGPNDEVTVNSRRPAQVTQRKVTISPRRTIRKSQMSKGNLEGPRFSRALPNVSTACTSVEGCSEGAIAFSQRQLHDMETLAEKLMSELKSMKDIVEQKLLFEAYRNVSIKNDADEVKSAINSATKVEENAKRWMSMMARDCTRFCKIMKMTPDSTTASKDSPPGERRKIMFADEAGGELCHIKFFDNGVVAPEAQRDAVKNEAI